MNAAPTPTPDADRALCALDVCGRIAKHGEWLQPPIATVEGFKLVDEDKLRALPEPIVIELHRNGMLMLMNLHIASLANMPALIERKARRELKRRGASDGPQ